MIYLLRTTDYTDAENASPQSVFTKYYQHLEVRRFAVPYLDTTGTVCEIGACLNFDDLNLFTKAKKSVLDPYNGASGSGHTEIPANIPYPLSLYRCLLGVDSQVVPDGAFDISFSVSVLEHIGQEEAGFDCNPTDAPPEAQEKPRDAFCQELFRTTKRGGITFHTIDHAARNLSWVRNFLKAGFKPLSKAKMPTVEDCLMAGDAVRQRRAWWHHEEPMPAEEQRLHGVLLMAFRKPWWSF